MSKVVNSKFDSETSVGTRPEPGLPTQIIQPDFEGRKTGHEALRATAEGPAWKSFPVCATFIRRGPEMGSDRVQRLLTVQMQFSKYVSVLYCSIYFSGTFSLLFITCFLLQNKAFMWCHFLSLRAECKWREVTVAHEETQKHIIYELGDLNGYQYLASTTEEEHKGNTNVAGNFRCNVSVCVRLPAHGPALCFQGRRGREFISIRDGERCQKAEEEESLFLKIKTAQWFDKMKAYMQRCFKLWVMQTVTWN